MSVKGSLGKTLWNGIFEEENKLLKSVRKYGRRMTDTYGLWTDDSNHTVASWQTQSIGESSPKGIIEHNEVIPERSIKIKP